MGNDTCDKPGCRWPASREFTGRHGNTVDVCRTCYWRLTTGESVEPEFGFPDGGLTEIGPVPRAIGRGPLARDREIDPTGRRTDTPSPEVDISIEE